ncbi:unnamed protein product [Calypogeia fissa]
MAKQEEQDANLSTVLSPAQRQQLTRLIANIIASMRKAVADNFDASQNSLNPSSPVSKSPTNQSSAAAENPNIDTATLSPEDEEKAKKEAKKEAERREKILSTPKLKELRVAALEFFHTWEESVLKRIGEVIDSAETAEKQEQDAEGVEPPKLEKTVVEENTQDEQVDTALHALYPAIPTELKELEHEKKVIVLNATMLLLLSLEHYLAHSRVLLLYLASSLELSVDVLNKGEIEIAQGLLSAAKKMSADEETQKRSEENQTARRWKVGLATAVGAAVLGVTGGLAAPLLSAGIGAVLGGLGLGTTAAATLLGTLAQSGILVGSLFGAYGGRMTGKMMDDYAKEVEDFAFLPLRASGRKKLNQNGNNDDQTEDRRLRVTIGMSGWITGKEDIINPWRVISSASEVFALRYEIKSLLNLGNSMTTVISSAAWSVAKKQIIKYTIFATLNSALWPLNILKVRQVVDNPFSVAKTRADKAGIVLADALINKAQGERPVTLIGYSLGARVIYSCLMSLADRKAFGLVESAVFIGTPCPSDADAWCALRSVVSGRLVNVYSENDYILAFLYRTSSIQFGVAGLQAVENVGVENVDVSKMVSGHLRYMHMVGVVLRKVGWGDLDLVEVEREVETLALLNDEGVAKGEENGEEEEGELEKKVEEKNKRSYMQWAAEKLHIN